MEVLEGAAAASGKASATQAVQRSAVCLIVKNLPYSTSEEDLVELFGGSGQLARLVLPPTRTLALVEYTEPQDARRSAHPALIPQAFRVLCSVGFWLGRGRGGRAHHYLIITVATGSTRAVLGLS